MGWFQIRVTTLATIPTLASIEIPSYFVFSNQPVLQNSNLLAREGAIDCIACAVIKTEALALVYSTSGTRISELAACSLGKSFNFIKKKL